MPPLSPSRANVCSDARAAGVYAGSVMTLLTEVFLSTPPAVVFVIVAPAVNPPSATTVPPVFKPRSPLSGSASRVRALLIRSGLGFRELFLLRLPSRPIKLGALVFGCNCAEYSPRDPPRHRVNFVRRLSPGIYFGWDLVLFLLLETT